MSLSQPKRAVSEADAERVVFFETIYNIFQQAEQAAGGSIDRFYTIGGRTVCLRFAGTALIPYLTPALSHLATEPTSAPALTICLWDQASTDIKMPLLLSSFMRSLSGAWWVHVDSRGEMKGYNSDRIRAVFHPGPNILSMLDVQKNLAVYRVEEASQLPYYERGSPLRSILHGWINDQTNQFVHAGAVGTATGGVLLVGKGGSGKSTTALACLGSKLSYASDDYCLIATAHTPYVYSIYNTAKLRGVADLQRFPHLVPSMSNADRLETEKAMIFLDEHYPDKVIAGFPIQAILLPRVTGQTETTLKKATAGAALAALAPSTLFQLPGAGKMALQTMSKLVRQVPCYTLALGSDLSKIPNVILRLLSKD
jgi:hypothetical protein